MYGQEEKISLVHECPKCGRKMGNSPETIQRHDKDFCAKYLKEKAAKDKKPAPKKKVTRKKTSNAKKPTSRAKKKP